MIVLYVVHFCATIHLTITAPAKGTHTHARNHRTYHLYRYDKQPFVDTVTYTYDYRVYRDGGDNYLNVATFA